MGRGGKGLGPQPYRPTFSDKYRMIFFPPPSVTRLVRTSRPGMTPILFRLAVTLRKGVKESCTCIMLAGPEGDKSSLQNTRPRRPLDHSLGLRAHRAAAGKSKKKKKHNHNVSLPRFCGFAVTPHGISEGARGPAFLPVLSCPVGV